ncbi:MAG: hypothetical protein PHT40_02110 [Patescibacteria group bacterium]|nr:hypothetical protein [Patescibacteria group bacterium]
MKKSLIAIVAVATLFCSCVVAQAKEATSYHHLEGTSEIGFYVVPLTDNIFDLIGSNLESARVWDSGQQKYVELDTTGLKYYARHGAGFIIKVKNPQELEVVGEPVSTSDIKLLTGWNFVTNTTGSFYNYLEKDCKVIALWIYTDDGYKPVSVQDFELGDGTPFWVCARKPGNLKLKNSQKEPDITTVFTRNLTATPPPIQ